MIKKFLVVFILFLSLFSFNANSILCYNIAYSLDCDYLRVVDHTTPFYSDSKGENFLFYLPYTYYVKPISQKENFYYVECFGLGSTPAIEGYVPKDKLYLDTQKVTNPYLDFSIVTSADTVLFIDATLSNFSQHVFKGRNLNYLGKFPLSDGTNAYYVSFNGRLGYVKESFVMPFTIPDQENDLTFLDKDNSSSPPLTNVSPSVNNGDDFFSLKVIVIVCLSFAGILAIFFAFRPKHQKQQNISYYDENDYE